MSDGALNTRGISSVRDVIGYTYFKLYFVCLSKLMFYVPTMVMLGRCLHLVGLLPKKNLEKHNHQSKPVRLI